MRIPGDTGYLNCLRTSCLFHVYQEKDYLIRKYQYHDLRYWVVKRDLDAIRYKVGNEGVRVDGNIISFLLPNERDELDRISLEIYNYLLGKIYISEYGIEYEDLRIIRQRIDNLSDYNFYINVYEHLDDKMYPEKELIVNVSPRIGWKGDYELYQEIGYRVEKEGNNEMFPKKYKLEEGFTVKQIIACVRHGSQNMYVEGVRNNNPMGFYQTYCGRNLELFVYIIENFHNSIALDRYLSTIRMKRENGLLEAYYSFNS